MREIERQQPHEQVRFFDAPAAHTTHREGGAAAERGAWEHLTSSEGRQEPRLVGTAGQQRESDRKRQLGW